MKILVLSNCPIVEHQGSGFTIISTARSLTELGHEVHTISPDEFSCFRFFGERAKIYRLSIGMGWWVLRHARRIHQYGLIILYGAESFFALFLLRSVLRTKAPIVLHSNGLEVHVGKRLDHYKDHLQLEKRWFHFNLSCLFMYCYRNVNAIWTVSKYDADFAIHELDINPEKVQAIELFLPDIFFDATEDCKPSSSKIISYCGTWIQRKGIEALKSAVPEILRAHPDYRFQIIGVGDGFTIQDHFPEDVIEQIDVFPLVTSKTELIRLYCNSAIFLFPSYCESFGLVVAEAMICCCAVITGPTGFAATLQKWEEAAVLEVPDEKSVFNALQRLISDEHLRTTIAENGRKRAGLLRRHLFTAGVSNSIRKLYQAANTDVG